MRSLRHVVRSWLAHPVLTGAACLSLAVGTAGAGASWALADALFFPAWPFRDPGALVRLSLARSDVPAPATTLPSVVWSLAQERLTALDGLAAAGAERLMVTTDGTARLTDVLFVSGTFFHVVGPSVPIGRPLTPVDDRATGETPAAVIGDAFRRDTFGADVDPRGQTILVEGRQVTVVGVADRQFFGLEVGRRVDVFLPLSWEPTLKQGASRLTEGRAWWLSILGRVPRGRHIASIAAQVNAELAVVVDAPGFEGVRSVVFGLVPTGTWPSALRGQYGEALLVLVAMTALILCVTAVNAASAMVARCADRMNEIRIRYALGARSRQVIGGFVLDTLMLALVGTAGGMYAAFWLARAVVPSLTVSLDRGIDAHLAVSVSWRLIAASAAAGVASGLLIGVWPAVKASREAQRVPFGSAAGGGGASRAVLWLVTAQLAVSVTLAGVGAVFVRSYLELKRETSGADEVLLLSLSGPSGQGLPLGRLEDLVTRVRAVPGARAASAATYTPLSGLIALGKVDVPGFSSADVRDVHASVNRVTPGFFDVFGLTLLEGRAFTDDDRAGTPLVAVVNHEFSKHYFRGGRAVGELVSINGQRMTIVGEVETTKYRHLREAPMRFVYLPFAQGAYVPQAYRLAVRVEDSLALRGPLLRTLRAALPDIGVQFQTLSEEAGKSVGRDRLVARITAFYAALALLMSMTGLYGTFSYLVTRRRREIAVRMAVGADAPDIVRLILRRMLSVLAVGSAVGVALSASASQAIASRLFGIDDRDYTAIAGAVVLFVFCGFAATLAPVRRATKTPPVAALRSE